MDSQTAISFRNFASCMGDGRMLAKIDAYIQEHLLEVSEQEDFLKLPRLKVSRPQQTFLTQSSGSTCRSMYSMWCILTPGTWNLSTYQQSAIN